MLCSELQREPGSRWVGRQPTDLRPAVKTRFELAICGLTGRRGLQTPPHDHGASPETRTRFRLLKRQVPRPLRLETHEPGRGTLGPTGLSPERLRPRLSSVVMESNHRCPEEHLVYSQIARHAQRRMEGRERPSNVSPVRITAAVRDRDYRPLTRPHSRLERRGPRVESSGTSGRIRTLSSRFGSCCASRYTTDAWLVEDGQVPAPGRFPVSPLSGGLATWDYQRGPKGRPEMFCFAVSRAV